MDDTPKSLLERVRRGASNDDWERLTEIYTPFLRRMAHHFGVSDADADDLQQEVFAVVVREIGSFEHNQQRGAFRRWLRQITLNRLQGVWRRKNSHKLVSEDSAQLLANQPNTDSELERLWDAEHDAWVTRKLLERLEPEFTTSTWQAFCRLVMEGRAAADVAAELGLTTNAVLIAKSRVLHRFREEIDGLIN